jgi:hypothetical protein
VSTESLELAKTALLDERRDAERSFNRGLAAIAMVPVGVYGGVMLGIWLDSFLPIVIAALYTMVGGCFGGVSLLTSIFKLRRTKRELRELEDSRLPKARLLT